MRLPAFLVTAILILAPFMAQAAGEAGFEGGAGETVVELEPPSFRGVAGLTVPAGSHATKATMHVSGMASGTDASAYPANVSLAVNGTEIWGFREPNFGALGRQDTFFDGRRTADLEFGTDGGSATTWVRLPKDAVVESASVNLTSSPKFIARELINFTGNSQGKNLGLSATRAGDVNGDGYADVAAGYNGGVFVHYGGPAMNRTPDVVLASGQSADRFGTAVAGAGDINGDGYEDIVVGASWGGAEDGVNHSGKAYLYLGGQLFDDRPDWIVRGFNEYDELGKAVAGAGDVNGDGYDDFLISVESRDNILIILGGPDLGNLSTMVVDIPGLTFGISIAGAGDLNSDGYDDVAIGDPHLGTGPESMGAVRVLFGGKQMDPYIDLTISDGSRWSKLGKSLSGAGDVNNDGYDDLVALAVQSNGSMPGAAYVYLGGPAMDGTPDYNLTGIYTMDDAGSQSVACAGDINRDGCDDVLAGAYYESRVKTEAGAAFLFYGGTGMDASADWSFAGGAAGDHLGFAVAGAGDVNGDGFDDFIISAPGNDSGAQNAGTVYVCTLVNTTFPGPVNSSLSVGAKPVWSYPGVFQYGRLATAGDFSAECNAYLRGAAVAGSDGFGNEFVDVPLACYAMTEGVLKLADLSIVYDCDFETGNFASSLNAFTEANRHLEDSGGNITVPVDVASSGAGRVRLSGLDIAWDLPPARIRDVPDLGMDEDTAVVTLADLYEYFQDDVDASSELGFSVVSSTNRTFVRLWITVDRYLSADAMTGDANDNWTGTVEAVVACVDNQGQKTSSRPFTITVRNVNDAPAIVSEPALEARTGAPYYYNASAVDGDNDTLLFRLAEAPTNMSIDASSGRTSWVPQRKGLYGVTVVASDGELSGSQDYEITVPNSPPRITDATVPEALVGVPWDFTVPAMDDDGDELSFSLLSGSPAMKMNSTTGMLDWTPPDVGNYSITVGVSDGEANATRDFGIVVVQGNRAPFFTSVPARNATVGLAYAYEARAKDLDSDQVFFSMVSGPPGMMIDGSSGLVNWTPAAVGDFTVRLSASDGRGGEAFQEFSVRVAPKILPAVNIIVPSEGQKVRGRIAVEGNATRGTLDVVWVQVRVDGGDWTDVSGISTWRYVLDTAGLRNGPHTLQVRAFDGQDFSGPVDRKFVVDNPVSATDGSTVWYWAVLVLAILLVASAYAVRRLVRARR
jgi:hypothetical protein